MTPKTTPREKCQKVTGSGFRQSRCSRYAVVNGYCLQHDPATRKARQEARDAAWRREWDLRDQRRMANTLLEKSKAALVTKVRSSYHSLDTDLQHLCDAITEAEKIVEELARES